MRKSRSYSKCSVPSFVQEDAGHAVARRTDSSGSNLFLQSKFEQFSQEAAVATWICSTDSTGLSRRIKPRAENAQYRSVRKMQTSGFKS